MYWSESELQLFFVYSHSLHWMLHYLIPSVIYVMNWESDVLLVLDKSSVMWWLVTDLDSSREKSATRLLESATRLWGILVLLQICKMSLNRVHTVCATHWRF